MLLRLSSSAERVFLVILAACVFLFSAYFGIRSARAAYLAEIPTRDSLQRATQLEPRDARNWYLLGRYWQYNFEDPNTQWAIAAYRTSLSLDPHASDVWLDLGAAYEMDGNIDAARDAFLKAKAAYPLSADVSWRYGNFLLRRGELDAAFTEIHHAVQADPKRSAEAFSRCYYVQPDVNLILDRVLPPQPNVYLDVITALVSDNRTDTALKVWDRLVTLHPQLPLKESWQLISTLRQNGQFAVAHRVWGQAVTLSGLSSLPDPPSSVLWDGSFESGLANLPYAWIFPDNSHGVDIRFDSQEHHSGSHSLRLTFDGKSNLSFADVCHYVPVQSAVSYRFSAWVEARGLTSDQGIRFQLRSLGSKSETNAEPIATTSEVHGTTPWTPVEITWTPAADAQEAQVCVIRNQSDQSNSNIRGTVWIDDVALVPVSAKTETPKP